MTESPSSGHSINETPEQVLRRRADSLGRETIEEESSGRLALLLFRLGEEWYAIRVADVREIFQEYQLTYVPGVPDFVLGVVNVRGEILSVTDPAKMMGIGEVALGTEVQAPAIVVSNGEVVTALLVDEIGDIADVPNQALEPPVSIIDRGQAEFIAGSVHLEDSMVGLLHAERVLEPIVSGGRH